MEEGGGRKGPDTDQMSGDEGKEKRKEEETQQMYTKGTYHFRFFFFFLQRLWKTTLEVVNMKNGSTVTGKYSQR